MFLEVGIVLGMAAYTGDTSGSSDSLDATDSSGQIASGTLNANTIGGWTTAGGSPPGLPTLGPGVHVAKASLVFVDIDGRVTGTLSWEDGKLTFSGKASPSAKKFLEVLKNSIFLDELKK